MGYWPIKCESRPPDSGDGFNIAGQKCHAYGASKSQAIRAFATCSTKSTSVATSGSMYLEKQEVVASCPANVSAIGCYCHSPWSSCWQTSFKASADGACKQKVGASASHRRRGVGGGAGVRVYALCGNGIEVPEDSVKMP